MEPTLLAARVHHSWWENLILSDGNCATSKSPGDPGAGDENLMRYKDESSQMLKYIQEAAWRVPLAMQLVPAITLGVGILFMPFSPRCAV